MRYRYRLLMAVAILILAVAGAVTAQSDEPGLVRGAMLYDNWIKTTGQNPPAGNMPIWGRQTSNTRSGEDTWRCVSCHGWDYQGMDGAYASGGEMTGFPGVYTLTRDKSPEQIEEILKGAEDREHDFSGHLDETAISDLALFLKDGLIDDTLYINTSTREVIGPDIAAGKENYEQVCAACHGADGNQLAMRFQGQDAGLAVIAKTDPWRFLHKTRYGTPGTKMPVGADYGWTASEGRDVLAYAQTFPVGPLAQEGGSLSGVTPEARPPAGQSSNIFGGLATALGAMVSSLGFVILLGLVLVGVVFLIVWSLS